MSPLVVYGLLEVYDSKAAFEDPPFESSLLGFAVKHRQLVQNLLPCLWVARECQAQARIPCFVLPLQSVEQRAFSEPRNHQLRLGLSYLRLCL